MTGGLPFEGLVVLDVSSFIAAPAAAVVLGDYGADVIKVEQPGEGDPHRTNINLTNFPKAAANYPWHMDARNKRSIALDLKSDAGRAALDRLIARCDVLITNFPFPVRARLRLNYEDVRRVNPRVIYASFSGYGETGPDKDQIGFDSNAYFARSGLLDSARYEGQPPAFSLPGSGDRPSAMGFLSAILIGLMTRERTGEGTWVASSLLANGLWANGVYAQGALLGGFLPPRPPRERPRSAIANIYETRDGRWMQVSIVREDKMWGALCRAIGRPELEHDARFAETPVRRANAAALTAILDEVFKQQDWAYWHHLLTEVNIPHGPIARAEDIPDDAQAVAACAVVETANPEMPRTIAAPFQVGGLTPRKAGPGPGLGEHTDEILREAGFAAEEIAALKANRAVA
jgi:crotonobetainyl-CoA:carnitine CoA-transferase CaiB-like acyl-CoA transferase